MHLLLITFRQSEALSILMTIPRPILESQNTACSKCQVIIMHGRRRDSLYNFVCSVSQYAAVHCYTCQRPIIEQRGVRVQLLSQKDPHCGLVTDVNVFHPAQLPHSPTSLASNARRLYQPNNKYGIWPSNSADDIQDPKRHLV